MEEVDELFKELYFQIQEHRNSCTVSLKEIPAQMSGNQEWIAELIWKHDPPSRRDQRYFDRKIFPKLSKTLAQITGNAWVLLDTSSGPLLWVDGKNEEVRREAQELIQELSNESVVNVVGLFRV